MPFSFLLDYQATPLLFYDGAEFATLPLEVPGLAESFLIELYRSETRHWRHCFTPPELQHLKDLHRLDFRFTVVGEWAIFPAIQQELELRSFWRDGQELSVAFSYDERSPRPFVAWLVAVVTRPLDEKEYRRRIVVLEHWTN